MDPHYLICTDLDGSLLDENYQWAEAQPALEKISANGIPLILNSSKTFAEIHGLVKKLKLETPIVCENGGVVGIPQSSPLAHQVEGASFMGYTVLYPGISREFILEVAGRLRDENRYRFRGFTDWSIQEVSEITGLTIAQAALAKRRHATEPILWEEGSDRLNAFEAALSSQGVRVVKGGRFLHLMGQVDKSAGMELVLGLYRKSFPDTRWVSLALGDSANDLEMLSAADIAGVIPDRHGNQLSPTAAQVVLTKLAGPRGWNEIVEHVLKEKTGI
jgi:mannosyl-3-phosphoglycerate phosphatase